MESVISSVCALRVIKTRGHSLPGRLRQRGASGPGLLCWDCLDVLSPCISLTTSDTRLHSTRVGTNVSLCGSEGPSRSDGIKSKRTLSPTDRQTERVRSVKRRSVGQQQWCGPRCGYLSISVTSAALLSQPGERLGTVTSWKMRGKWKEMASVPQTTSQTFVDMKTTPHRRHCCFYICPGVSLVNISQESCSGVQCCQIVSLFTYLGLISPTSVRLPSLSVGMEAGQRCKQNSSNHNNNRVEITVVRAKSIKLCGCFLILNWQDTYIWPRSCTQKEHRVERVEIRPTPLVITVALEKKRNNTNEKRDRLLLMPHVFPLEEQIQTFGLDLHGTSDMCMTHSAAAGQRRQQGGRGEESGGEKWKERRGVEIFFLFGQTIGPPCQVWP